MIANLFVGHFCNMVRVTAAPAMSSQPDPSCRPGDDMARKDVAGAAVTLTLLRGLPTNRFAVSFGLQRSLSSLRGPAL